MATWTLPKSWSAESSRLESWNTYLQQNMEALKNPPSDDYSPTYTGSNFGSTSSSTWGTIPSFSLSLTTFGGDLLIGFHCYATLSSGRGYFDITVDSQRQGGTDGILALSYTTNVSLIWLKQELVAGDHTVAVQFKSSGGGAALTLEAVMLPQFWVREVS